jgi:hypothetical protein
MNCLAWLAGRLGVGAAEAGLAIASTIAPMPAFVRSFRLSDAPSAPASVCPTHRPVLEVVINARTVCPGRVPRRLFPFFKPAAAQPPGRFRVAAVLIAALCSALGGCVQTLDPPGFRIVGSDPQSTAAPSGILLSQGNRLSLKAPTGEIETGGLGVFINPAYVMGGWYLMVEHVVGAEVRNAYFRRLNAVQTLEINADGEVFVIQPSDLGHLSRPYLTASPGVGPMVGDRQPSVAYRETATFRLSELQLTAMIKASRLAITVVGSAVRLDVGSNNVAGNFQRNLDRFYTRATGRASGAG